MHPVLNIVLKSSIMCTCCTTGAGTASSPPGGQGEGDEVECGQARHSNLEPLSSSYCRPQCCLLPFAQLCLVWNRTDRASWRRCCLSWRDEKEVWRRSNSSSLPVWPFFIFLFLLGGQGEGLLLLAVLSLQLPALVVPEKKWTTTSSQQARRGFKGCLKWLHGQQS